MSAFILNPRRVPRAPIRCAARVAFRTGCYFVAPAVDYGPRGCQLEAPEPVDLRARLFVELVNERVPDPREFTGSVAWSNSVWPGRIGIAFDGGSFFAATLFFEQLAAQHPAALLDSWVPDRISADTLIAPATPPQEIPRLRFEEAEVLQAVGTGIRTDALCARLGAHWEGRVNSLFALLGRQYLVIGAPDERAAQRWIPHFAQAIGKREQA